MSVLFNIAIDWVLRRTAEDQRRGKRWAPFSTLEDLDFADDLALLSHTWQHTQEKTDRLSIFSNQVGLTDSLKKREAMRVNVPCTDLGSVLCQDVATGVDIRNRLNKARNAFVRLRSVWRSANYSTKTKLNSSLRLEMLANDGARSFSTQLASRRLNLLAPETIQ